MFLFIFVLSLFQVASAVEEEIIDCTKYVGHPNPRLEPECKKHNERVKAAKPDPPKAEASEPKPSETPAPEPKPAAVADAGAAPQLQRASVPYVPMIRESIAMTGGRPIGGHVLTIARLSEVVPGSIVCVYSGGWLDVVGPEAVQIFADMNLDGVFHPDSHPHTCAWSSTPEIHVVNPVMSQVFLYYMIESSQGVSGYPAWVIQKVTKHNRSSRAYVGYTQMVRMPKHQGEL